MLTRRAILGMLASTAGQLTLPAAAAPLTQIAAVDLRGSIDATEHGIVPGTSDDQSKAFEKILRKAAARKVPVFLPPGDYRISNITLPDQTRITGVPGASRIVYTGDGHLFAADGAARIELADIVIDGGNRWLADYAGALVQLRGVGEAIIDNCEITGARKHAVQMERCGGRITGSRLSGAAQAAIYAVECHELSITDNMVADCGNGGILVHRWTKGADGTIVSGNRIARIGANDGGTGENGNGINLFRADAVMIADNHVSDCAFSAIRANAASDVQITGNQCLRSGETAIYAEFGFEGAMVAGNLVDGAANGVLIVNFDEGGRLATVANNLIRNLSLTGPYAHDGAGFGFGIAVEADTAVTGNVIENAPKWGMMLGWGPYLRNVVATGNLVRGAPIGCAVSVVEGAGGALISGNLFTDTPGGAVVGFRWNEAASGDLAAADAPRFAHLTIDGNRG